MIQDIVTKLQGHLPDSIYDQVPQTFPLGIDGPKRLSHLLGQCKLESMNFTHFTENLNYSGDALWSLFKSHFSTPSEADSYARQPECIANRIYANRMGNGDEQSGDGYKYRGRGALQITGKANYQVLGNFLNQDFITNPDPVATDYQIASAAWFFHNNNLWTICDKGTDAGTITTITHHVNGGENGLQQRIQYTQEFYNLLTN